MRPINPLKIDANYQTAIRVLRKDMIAQSRGKCQDCGVILCESETQIHHVNGCGLDWRRRNLRLLCPDCHVLRTQALGQNWHLTRNSRQFSMRAPILTTAELHESYNANFPRA